ncbi:hypothetical protein SK128_024604, partial [Halocaridina rubra]
LGLALPAVTGREVALPGMGTVGAGAIPDAADLDHKTNYKTKQRKMTNSHAAITSAVTIPQINNRQLPSSVISLMSVIFNPHYDNQRVIRSKRLFLTDPDYEPFTMQT